MSPTVNPGPEGDLATLQTPYPPGSAGTSGGPPPPPGLANPGGHAGVSPESPWVPASTPPLPRGSFVTTERSFGVEDTTTLPRNWSWILGQLQWAYQRFGAMQINPSWFSDNHKGSWENNPSDSDAFRYDGLYGEHISSDTDLAPDISASNQMMTAAVTDDPSQVCAPSYVDHVWHPAVYYVPQLPAGTHVPVVWPQMSAGDRQAFIDKQLQHPNSYQSDSLDEYYNQTWAPIEQLFQAVLTVANQLEQGVQQAFVGAGSYGDQDQQIQRTWNGSEGTLRQAMGADNAAATEASVAAQTAYEQQLAQTSRPPPLPR